MNWRYFAQDLIGRIPLTAETAWYLWQRHKPVKDQFRLLTLPTILPESASLAAVKARQMPKGKQIFIFATLHFWIEHTTLTGIALAGQGNNVTLAYLPYANWFSPVDRFTLRRRVLFLHDILKLARPALKPVCLMDHHPRRLLPPEVQQAVEEVSLFDSQYTLQAEEIDRQHPIYRLRLKRNLSAARAAMTYLEKNRPDVVIIPNGVILEFGVVYAVARYLQIPTTTYEFGEQSGHLWLAQNSQIIRHETDDLWKARGHIPLNDEQREWLKSFFNARQATQRGDSFARLWQEISPEGGRKIRQKLGLDARPVILFTTNVLGDSLTLGRQLFGSTMSDWITRLVQYFVEHTNVQLVIRIHPGENLTQGPSVTGVIRNALPEIPEHIHVIGPKDKVNTYDLMEIASLGIVYTTTSGLEMATRGIPVMTAGKTHYRGRGFTIDTKSYDEFFNTLNHILPNLPAHRLTAEQVELAWNYSYRFFHEFPRPFPWHILHIADDIKERPMHHVLDDDGLTRYASTFRYLTGEPMDWKDIDQHG